MLILSRQVDESIMIGEDVEVVVLGIQRGQVRLGIRAPGDTPVHRREIYDAIEAENRLAARSPTVDGTSLARALQSLGNHRKSSPKS